MVVELRSDSVHISGYVNVTGRESRPVITPRGKVNEMIERRAFEKSLARNDKIDMLIDHDPDRKVASTTDGTLTVIEDEVGLRAESVVTDEETMKAAKEKRIKGWSFNMRHVSDEVEERADKLPLRRIKDFDMSEITLVINKRPVYNGTSVEVRADDNEGEEVEYRAVCDVQIKKQVNNSEYEKRLKALERSNNEI